LKKKTYKRLKNRLYREIAKKQMAVNTAEHFKQRTIEAERIATYYKERFMNFGNNVDVIPPEAGAVSVCEWTVKVEPWGNYVSSNQKELDERTMDMYKGQLAMNLAKGMVENNLVQFIYKCGSDSPIGGGATLAAKAYAVPWERMPHRLTFRTQQYVEKALAEEGTKE